MISLAEAKDSHSELHISKVQKNDVQSFGAGFLYAGMYYLTTFFNKLLLQKKRIHHIAVLLDWYFTSLFTNLFTNMV